MVVTSYDNMVCTETATPVLRYVISYQQAKYIVDNYKGRTDEEKLINYIVKEKISELDSRESTRLASKSYNKGESSIQMDTYANGVSKP